jgi:hypothetical protein
MAGETSKKVADDLESPFLHEEILESETEQTFETVVDRLAVESPFEHVSFEALRREAPDRDSEDVSETGVSETGVSEAQEEEDTESPAEIAAGEINEHDSEIAEACEQELDFEFEPAAEESEDFAGENSLAPWGAYEAETQAVPMEHILEPPKAALPSSQRQYRFQIADSSNKPLANVRTAIHQSGRTYEATTDRNGWIDDLSHPGLSKFEGLQPFRIHVEGHVCSIVRGAALLSGDPETEYGGQFLDWQLADSDNLKERAAFWQEYEKERKNRASGGVFRFLQHDHVMRRPVKMLARDTMAVFEASPIRLRVGPIVRFADQRHAVVWVELETPALVRVRYGKAPLQQQLPQSGTPATEMMRHSTTVRVGGRHYALVALDQLEPDSVFLYTLEFGPVPATGNIPVTEADFTEAVFPRMLPSAVRTSQITALSSISFRKDEWLFFRTMPVNFDSFRFAHGSCRKWPGDTNAKKEVPGPDMLERFGSEWLAKKNWPDWPRFLLHTGDQIYADDIGTKQGASILRHRFAAVVPGPTPTSANDIAYGAWSGRFGFRYMPFEKKRPSDDDVDPKYLRSFSDYKGYDRSLVDAAIDTAIVVRRQASAHEKLADAIRPVRFKLRVLNHLLWKVPITEKGIPTIDKRRGLRTRDAFLIKHRNRSYQIEYPSAGETDPFDAAAGGVHAADYAEYSALYEQAWVTQHTRKSLAHLPSYMIFDDHEVTDDWNADKGWMTVVHSASDPFHLWPTTMTDALCAYWVYQGWGNLSPDEWDRDPRIRILHRCRKEGRDALPDLRRLVFERAIRPTVPGADRSQKLSWHYALPTGNVPFLVVDLRTDRDVNGNGELSVARFNWLKQSLLQTKSPAAFVLFPVPFLMPDPMLFAMRHPRFTGTLAGARSTAEFKRESDLEHPADNPVWDQVKNLLVELQRSSLLKTLVIISGDIHFSCNLDGQLPSSSKAPRLLQLISSGSQQKISTSKQEKLIGSYMGWLNAVSRAQGVDTHRGIRITLGGLEGPGKKLQNFLFKTSFALVDLKQTVVPQIVQTHLTWDRLSPTKGTLGLYTFLHATQVNASALMTLKDPGWKTPEGQPLDYPRVDGIGNVRELEHDLQPEDGYLSEAPFHDELVSDDSGELSEEAPPEEEDESFDPGETENMGIEEADFASDDFSGSGLAPSAGTEREDEEENE